MRKEEYKYLEFVDFCDLINWSVQGFLDTKLNYTNRYRFARIGDFFSKSQNIINIEDDVEYKRITVKINNNGVLLRDRVIGRMIGTKKQYIAKSGQFILSKIDARNGAFGIIPAELNNAIVTNDFPLFDIDTKEINPKFLLLITTTKQFTEFAQSCSSGTTNRQRMDIDLFLNQKIPLPTLQEQANLVANYYAKIKQAEDLQKQADEIEKEIEKYLFDELGIQLEQNNEKDNLLKFVDFKNISRWDTPFLIGKIPALKSKYQLDSFANVIKSNCFNPVRIDSSQFPDDDFRYIGMEHIEKESGKLLDMPTVKGREVKSQTLLVPKGYIIYGKLRPYLNKYWTNKTDFENIICSSEFIVFDIDENINKDFFVRVLSSKIIQSQLSDKTSGARMPRINSDIFFDLKFPLPPKDVQNRIVSNICVEAVKIEKCKLEAINLISAAEQEFEKEIFK